LPPYGSPASPAAQVLQGASVATGVALGYRCDRRVNPRTARGFPSPDSCWPWCNIPCNDQGGADIGPTGMTLPASSLRFISAGNLTSPVIVQTRSHARSNKEQGAHAPVETPMSTRPGGLKNGRGSRSEIVFANGLVANPRCGLTRWPRSGPQTVDGGPPVSASSAVLGLRSAVYHVSAGGD
jgi:hypothetical protein